MPRVFLYVRPSRYTPYVMSCLEIRNTRDTQRSNAAYCVNLRATTLYTSPPLPANDGGSLRVDTRVHMVTR